MTLLMLTSLLFVSVLGISLSALYFFVEAPAVKKRMRARLATVQQLFLSPSGEAELRLLQDELLSQIPAVHRILLHIPYVPRIQALLHQAAMEMTAGRFLLICISLGLGGFVVGALIDYSPPATLVLMGLCGAAPFGFVAFKRSRRLSRFQELFPDAIDLLARAVRAGHAFTTGFELIAREMPEPLASEFQVTYEQQNLGMPLREALDNFAERMPVPDVRFFVSALQIQRESGGNLAEILDKLSYVIRERFKILRQVKVYTAESRMSLYILTAVPPITALLLYIVNRDYIMTLFREPLGHKLLVTAVVLQVLGYLVMRRITQLKV